MNDAPCKNCPKKGCGTYHDKCIEYINWRDAKREASEERYMKETHSKVLMRKWWIK